MAVDPLCSSFFKYIYKTSSGYRFIYRSGDIKRSCNFYALSFGSFDAALSHAIRYRDDFLDSRGLLYLLDKSSHVKKRNGSMSFYRGFPLPPGFSIQYVGCYPFYLVKSFGSGKKFRYSLSSYKKLPLILN